MSRIRIRICLAVSMGRTLLVRYQFLEVVAEVEAGSCV